MRLIYQYAKSVKITINTIKLVLTVKNVSVSFLKLTFKACNKSDYYSEHVKCNFTYSSGVVKFSSWTGCLDSYIDSTTHLCTPNCGTGSYGTAVYNSQAKVETS